MGRLRAVQVAILIMLCFASVSEAARSFTCNSAGRVFRFTSDLSPANLTLMWGKSASDHDIQVFFADTGDVFALGIGIENRIEQVTFGTLPGLAFDIVAMRAGGPNSKCFLAFGAEVQALAPDGPRRIRDLGSLEALAAESPHYARVLRTVRELTAIKAPLR